MGSAGGESGILWGLDHWISPSLIADLKQNPPRRIFAPGREHIGDVVNLTGPLRGLRELFPEAHITVEVGEKTVGLLENQSSFDDLWPRPTHQGLKGKLRHLGRLRKSKFDLAVILDDSNDLVLQAALGGISRRVGIWRGKKYQGLFDAWVRYRNDIHEVRDHGEELLRLFGLPAGHCAPYLSPSVKDRETGLTAWKQAGLPRVGIHPGASDPKRQWRSDSLREVMEAFPGDVVLIGGPNDGELLRRIDPDGTAPHISGGLSLLASASLLGNLTTLVCMDSGPMHMAAIMGTRVVAVYGQADPRHTGPVGQGHRILKQAEIQSASEVVDAVKAVLGETA